MVVTLYRIRTTSNRAALLAYLSGLPGYIDAGVLGGRTIDTTFDHANNAEVLAFLWNLADVSDGTVVIDPNGANIVRTLSQYNKNQRNDILALSEVYNETLTNLSTTYTNIFPNAVKNLRFPIDTNGFSKVGVIVTWNKNGGPGIHDFKLVDHNDQTKTLKEFTNITTDQHEDFNIDLSSVAAGHFANSIKFIKAMAKSSNGTDDPIFVNMRVYLRR